MQLLRLNGIMRTAVRLIRGLNLELDGPRFSFGVFSVISWFKVRAGGQCSSCSWGRVDDCSNGDWTLHPQCTACRECTCLPALMSGCWGGCNAPVCKSGV
jgi:hypothetical protein